MVVIEGAWRSPPQFDSNIVERVRSIWRHRGRLKRKKLKSPKTVIEARTRSRPFEMSTTPGEMSTTEVDVYDVGGDDEVLADFLGELRAKQGYDPTETTKIVEFFAQLGVRTLGALRLFGDQLEGAVAVYTNDDSPLGALRKSGLVAALRVSSHEPLAPPLLSRAAYHRRCRTSVPSLRRPRTARRYCHLAATVAVLHQTAVRHGSPPAPITASDWMSPLSSHQR